MNRSEKLLEAIGQIDDRLILDAQKAGAAGKPHGVGTAADSRRGTSRKKPARKKSWIYRYRGALAACAVLAICVGIYGLLSAEGLLLSPFDKSTDSAQQSQVTTENAADTVMEGAREEAAAEEAVPAEGTAVKEAPAEEAAESGTGDSEEQKSSQETDAAQEKDSSEKEGQEAAEQTETAEAETDETAEGVGGSEAGAIAECAELGNEAEAASAEEPRVMSLRPASEEVSDNDLEQITDLPASLMEAKAVKTSGTDVTVSFSNQYTDTTVTYGTMYELERQTQEGWSSVPAKENVAWTDILYELEAGKSVKETVRLESMFGTLEAGHYRLVKNCTMIAADQTKKELVLYMEFDITK